MKMEIFIDVACPFCYIGQNGQAKHVLNTPDAFQEELARDRYDIQQ